MKRPSKKALRRASHALRWAQFGYRNQTERHDIGEVRLWLISLAGFERRPRVIAEQLYVYALNTGHLYPTHMNMARRDLPRPAWRRWVRRHVLYGWCAEVDPSWMTPLEVARCARWLQRYYQERVREEGSQ